MTKPEWAIDSGHRYVDDEDWPSTAHTCRDRLIQENSQLRRELAEKGPRPTRFCEDFSPIAGTHIFMQMKNTDVCFDFYCECGHQGHYDGYFANAVRCSGCLKEFELPHSIKLMDRNPDCRYHRPVELDPEDDV